MADAKPQSAMPLPESMAGNFNDAVRWFNQMWAGGADPSAALRGSGPIPAAMMPTLDIKELDKRIADLRSVEHWLKLNQGLVQTTIQGLEMQRNTIAAWQSFGAAAAAGGAAASASGTSAAAPGSAPAGAPDPAAFAPAAWWSALHQQFAQMAASAMVPEAGTTGAPATDTDAPPPDAAPAAGARAPGKAAASKPR